MSDFISNRPDGKSDLYTYTPPSPSTESAPSAQEVDHQASIPPQQSQPSTPPTSPFSQSAPWQDFSYTPPVADPPAAEPKNPLATASMVLGIVTWGGLILCCGCFSPVTAILAIIFALISRENKKMNGKAVAGLVLGIAFLGLFFMFLLLLITGSVFETSLVFEEESVFSLFFRLLL